ncbi:hypothetical protein EIK77_000086, partial [Talaromyces pinophilus]
MAEGTDAIKWAGLSDSGGNARDFFMDQVDSGAVTVLEAMSLLLRGFLSNVTAETLPGAGAARSVETVGSAVVDSTGGAVISGVSAVGARSGEVVRSWAEGLSENGGCAGDGGRAAVAGVSVMAGDSGALDVSTVSSTRTGKYWDPGPDDVNCWAAV